MYKGYPYETHTLVMVHKVLSSTVGMKPNFKYLKRRYIIDIHRTAKYKHLLELTEW